MFWDESLPLHHRAELNAQWQPENTTRNKQWLTDF
nr:MAG TPA: hypothetical protein [Caudoviricetes sp.]